MKIGFIGLGKLGLPCAMAAATRHNVIGVDAGPLPRKILESRAYPHKELLAQDYLERTSLQIVDDVAEVVDHADLLFCAVQTPHDPLYEGSTRLPETRADFDYSHLRTAVEQVSTAAEALDKDVTLAIVSTVLPGTSRRELYPLLGEHIKFAYNPSFIAMGTTIPDYLAPEFVLLGSDDPEAAELVAGFYQEITTAQVIHMGVTSAELTKVLYNTFIGLKITMANTAMQICHELGADVDDVMGALGRASKRLTSSRYLRAGMGDGGGCHPRDNIALSWLSSELGMSYDLFGTMMEIRERQTEWLAYMAVKEARRRGMPIVVLGKSFKPETNITTGSPAVLLRNILEEQLKVCQWDPEIDEDEPPWRGPAVFVLATAHEKLLSMPLPAQSVVLDPWGVYSNQNVEVIQIGRRT